MKRRSEIGGDQDLGPKVEAPADLRASDGFYRTAKRGGQRPAGPALISWDYGPGTTTAADVDRHPPALHT